MLKKQNSSYKLCLIAHKVLLMLIILALWRLNQKRPEGPLELPGKYSGIKHYSMLVVLSQQTRDFSQCSCGIHPTNASLA